MILDLLFPSLCPHCKGGKPSHTFLCNPCSTDIDFTQKESFPPSLLNDLEYAIPYNGASISLYRLLLYKQQLTLAKSFTELLSLKLQTLNWPPFNLLTIPNMSTFYRLRHGYHPDQLLLKMLSRKLEIDTCLKGSLLKKNVLILTAKLDLKKVQETALSLSPHLPKSVYSLSLFSS